MVGGGRLQISFCSTYDPIGRVLCLLLVPVVGLAGCELVSPGLAQGDMVGVGHAPSGLGVRSPGTRGTAGDRAGRGVLTDLFHLRLGHVAVPPAIRQTLWGLCAWFLGIATLIL